MPNFLEGYAFYLLGLKWRFEDSVVKSFLSFLLLYHSRHTLVSVLRLGLFGPFEWHVFQGAASGIAAARGMQCREIVLFNLPLRHVSSKGWLGVLSIEMRIFINGLIPDVDCFASDNPFIWLLVLKGGLLRGWQLLGLVSALNIWTALLHFGLRYFLIIN